MLGRPGAFIAGLVYLFAPYTLRTVFDEGNYPRTLVLLIMPVVLRLTLDVLAQESRRRLVLLSVFLALLILSHQMMALMFMASLAIPVLLFSWLSPRSALYRALLVGAFYLLGVGLTAGWMLPAVTQMDLPSVPNLSLLPERMGLHSISWSALDPRTRSVSIEAVYFGLPILVLATLGTVLSRRGDALMLYCSGWIGIAIAFGVNNPLYQYLPMSGSLFPERFLNVVTLFYSVLVGLFVRSVLTRRKRWLRWGLVFVAMLVLWNDWSFYFNLARFTQYSDFKRAATLMARIDNDGRVVDQVGISAAATYLPSAEGGRNQAYGWGIEGTAHLPAIVYNNLALKLGFPDFVARNYALWNVRLAFVDPLAAGLLRSLETAGFQPRMELEKGVLLISEQPSSYLMEQDRDVLVIGRGGASAAMLFPWVAQGTSDYVDDYPLEFLDQFKAIVLYDYKYRDLHRIEDILRWLAGRGKLVMVDLALKESEILLNVGAQPETTAGELLLQRASDADFIPESALLLRNLQDSSGVWHFYVPDELEGVLSFYLQDGRKVPVLGYRAVGDGRVYFLGLSLFNQALEKQDANARAILESMLLRVNPNRSLAPPPFPVTQQKWDDEEFSFTYESDTERRVIISVSYSPHWSATLDGRPLQPYNYENLNEVYLPAGTHSVRFSYQQTPLGWVANGLSLVSLVALVVSAIFLPPRLPLWLAMFWSALRKFLLGESDSPSGI